MEMKKLEGGGGRFSRADSGDSSEPPFFPYINKTVVLLEKQVEEAGEGRWLVVMASVNRLEKLTEAHCVF